MDSCGASWLHTSSRTLAPLTLVCVCLLVLVGCAPFQQAGHTPKAQATSTSALGGSVNNSSSSAAVQAFDPSIAMHAITQWDLQVQSNHILDGGQTRSVEDSGWATDNFHKSEHLRYGFSQLQDPVAHYPYAPLVVGSVEYVFFVTDSAGATHYGLLLGTVDQAGRAITVVTWLDAHPLTQIVQLFSASVAEPLDWGLSNYSLGVIYTEPSEMQLATALASGVVLHHTIVISFDLTAALSSSSAKGGTASLSPAQVQDEKVVAALTKPGTPLPAGVYSSAKSSGFTVSPSDGAISPLNIVLPASPTPHF